MTEAAVLEIGQYALRITLMVAAPLLLASLAVGIMVSIVQVATSLQDATMTFVPKIFAVGLALFFIGPWMMRVLVECARKILSSIPGVVG